MKDRERYLDMLEKFRPSQAEDTSDADLRDSLDRSLRAVEPGYLGIDAVFPSDSKVVYAVAPEDEVKFLRRPYTLNDDGSVELSNEVEEVRPVTRFEPVTAECGCGGQASSDDPPAPAKEDTEMENLERAKAIIASGKTCFTDAQAEFLAAAPEELLKHLEEQMAKPEEKPEPKVEVRAPETEQEWLEAAPESIRKIVEDHRAAATKEHDDLVAELATAQEVYSKDELQVMDTPALQKVKALAGNPKKKDFSGQTPRAAADDETTVPAPPSLVERFAKKSA